MHITTDRLELTPPEAGDFPDFLRLRTDARAREHLGGPMPEGAVWRQFGHARTSWMLGEPSLAIARERATGAFVGAVGPWGLFGRGDPEFVWELVPEMWGRGYAREAAGAAIDWLFETLGWPEVRFYIAPGNAASLALAGFLGSRRMDRPGEPAPHRRVTDELWVCRRPRLAPAALASGGAREAASR